MIINYDFLKCKQKQHKIINKLTIHNRYDILACTY